ncbi:NUDIX domain-containing protein [uncultured Pseudonocardia sp.]|uniref:NUDIX hydrolase n=1 Tax=uncultured Pseudonocardia sp. TaxID=211455 RepID=UPI00261E9AD2|nr:NUDIX domain-containing protein [uncultured Pseudonocardia sp.]
MTAGLVVSVGWVHVRDGRLLVVRTRGRSAFYLPGGKPEAGEDLTRALCREIAEELGLVVVPSSIAAMCVVHARAHGLPGRELRMHCYRADVTGVPRPGREIAEMAWVAAAERSRCAPAVQQVLDRLLPHGG